MTLAGFRMAAQLAINSPGPDPAQRIHFAWRSVSSRKRRGLFPGH